MRNAECEMRNEKQGPTGANAECEMLRNKGRRGRMRKAGIGNAMRCVAE